jgi:transposase
MYVARVPNRSSPPAILLRESYRDGDKVKTRTLANLSDWPQHKIEALSAVLKGATAHAPLKEALEIVRSRRHGHVAAALGSLRRLGLDALIASRKSRERELACAMVVARIIAPSSKLALARGLDGRTRDDTLAEALGLGDATVDELYEAMDFVLDRQEAIENALAKRHLSDGTLVLYDVTSTYFEGRHCPLARLGHSRDGRRDKLQIVFGLLTDAEGRPVAVEVFEGNTGDPKTLPAQVQKLRERFGLSRVVLVGDRGMLTSARIEADLKTSPGIEWITALRAPAIKQLLVQGAIQLSLFDARDLVEISSVDYPGERLIVCRNPLLADERKRKRGELLTATEKELAKISAATSRQRNKLRGKDKIGLRVGKVLGRYKVAKHFRIEITEAGFRYARDPQSIETEAYLDGLYVIRTRLAREALDAEATVLAYKRLAQVERAFRSLKTVDLKVRPIRHHLPQRVRAHVLLCMLAYYVEWDMRRRLAPMLFDDDDRESARRERASVVARSERSARARAKAFSKTTEDGQPVHSFQTLLKDLATITKNRVRPKQAGLPEFELITRPTPLQARALRLLDVAL